MLDWIFQGWRSTIFGVHGYFEFTKSGFIKNAKNFNPASLDVDLTGKTVVLTGANAGLGSAVLSQLAKRNASVLMICRNKERGQMALDEVVKETGNQSIRLCLVDMSIPREIKQFVDSIDSSIDILINNAGVLLNERKETVDGLETTFATNTLGVYFMTELLLPKLTPTGRVINVSSGGMYNTKLSTHDLQSKNNYDGVLAYAQSKRAEVELTNYWAKKYPNITFYSMHPGWASTPGLETSLPSFFSMLNSNLRTKDQGADTIVWSAISKEALETAPNGSFLFDRQVAKQHITLGNTFSEPEVVENLVSECESILTSLKL